MDTSYIRRVFFIIRQSQRASFNTWWAANIDTGGAGDQTFSVPLSATGNLPATHWGACGAFTDSQFKQIVQLLITLTNNVPTGSITLPANWDTMTQAEKRDWLRSQIPTIRSVLGVTILADDNDGVWDDYEAEIARRGLVKIQPAL